MLNRSSRSWHFTGDLYKLQRFLVLLSVSREQITNAFDRGQCQQVNRAIYHTGTDTLTTLYAVGAASSASSTTPRCYDTHRN